MAIDNRNDDNITRFEYVETLCTTHPHLKNQLSTLGKALPPRQKNNPQY